MHFVEHQEYDIYGQLSSSQSKGTLWGRFLLKHNSWELSTLFGLVRVLKFEN